MKTLPALLLSMLAATTVLGGLNRLQDDTPRVDHSNATFLVRTNNSRSSGRLEGDAATGFRFRSEGPEELATLVPGMVVKFAGTGPVAGSGSPPYKVELGLGQQISGRIVSINERLVTLIVAPGEQRIPISRAGVRAVVQRPGETMVFEEGFETLSTSRWASAGGVALDSTVKSTGKHSLKIPAGEGSAIHTLKEPIGSGRLELAFEDSGATAAGQQWYLDLAFRGAMGSSETIRIFFGWAEESLAVGSPGGPALAVQRLKRKAGWHRLSLRFGPDGTSLSVDGDELAHGKGFEGPLAELRLGSVADPKEKTRENLAGHVDDIRLVRFEEPVGTLEIDATQDEIRLTGGDQLFGKFLSADPEKIRIEVDGSDVRLNWSEVSGIHFRRESKQAATVSGLLVRVEWRSAPGNDPRDANQLEGVLTGLSEQRLSIDAPYVGTVAIPLDCMKSLTVLGSGTRLVIDSTAHHLGDEVSVVPPLLDPPQPEGGVLERSVNLREIPSGQAFLVLDVIQVVSETPPLPYSDLVKDNQLRTNLKLNGALFDYVNHYIFSTNETSERVRIPIPKEVLRVGENVIRFELMGTKNDPNSLDDLGLLGIAVEFESARTR